MTSVTNFFDDLALRSVDAVQVENPWMYEYVQSVNVNRVVDIRYAPPGVDDELFVPIARNLRQKSDYILCVGRLSDPRKNIELLLAAFAAADVAGMRLRLAGATAPPQAFWSMAADLGVTDRIDYICQPTQSELVRLYQNALMFALPSDEEGLGVVLLEAMACGVPVISTMSGGPQGFIDDGVDGYLVPLNNVEKLSARIVCLANDHDTNASIGNAGRLKIESALSERVAGREFVAMWDRLLERSRQRRA